MILDPDIPCDVPRQSGGSTRIPSLTGQPKSVEINAIDTEAIEPEDLELRRIELDRNLGTGPYQRQERFVRNSITEDMGEFGKVGAEMHSLCDLAENTAESDLEDGVLRKMLASPLKIHTCKIEKTVNPLECQSHRGNLLHCYRKKEQVQRVPKLILEKA